MFFGDFGLHVVTLGHHFDPTERIFRRPFLVPIFRSEKKTQKTSLSGHWGALCGHWGALRRGPAECAEPLGGIRGVKHLHNCVGVLISGLTRCDPPPPGASGLYAPRGGAPLAPHFWEICDFDSCTELSTVTPGCPSHHTLGI